jgi:hypothetical protein
MITPQLGRNYLSCVTINHLLLCSTDFYISILHTQRDGLSKNVNLILNLFLNDIIRRLEISIFRERAFTLVVACELVSPDIGINLYITAVVE